MASIVDEIRNDREKGAKRLESEYKAGLMALARRFCADESNAEELVNRTFAAVVENIDGYLEQSAFFGWMSKILINLYSKDTRRKSNEMEFNCAEVPEGEPDDEACARVFREVDASILRDAIDRLPHDMKQTLMMHYFMDMPVKEVARVLSIPSGTVMWRLHYARKILGAKLGANVKKTIVAIAGAAILLVAGAAVVLGIADVVPTAEDAGREAVVQGVAMAGEGDASREPSGEPPSAASSAAGASSTPQTSSPQQGEQTMKKSRGIRATLKSMLAALIANTIQLNAAPDNGDGYIESEGDAFVSLGHCAGPNTKLEVDFQLTEVEFDTKPFGSWGNNTSIPMFSLYISHTGDYVARYSWDGTDVDGARQAINCNIADLKRHVISFDASTVTYASTNVTDGGEAYSYKFTKGFSTKTSPYPLAVFARGGDVPATQPGHFGGATKMRVYGVKIYESGTLVKTYTPCLKGGVPGLKVTGPGVDTFVTGIDVTKVKYGGDILVEKDDPYLSTGDFNDVTKASASGVSVYFDTRYVVTPASRIEFDFAPLTPNIPVSGYNHAPEFMYAQGPSRGGTRNEIEIVGRTSTGYLGYKLGYSDYHDFKVPMSTAFNIRRTLSIDSHKLVMTTAGYTNSVDTISADWGVETDMNTVTLQLATATEGNYFAPMKIYGLKIFEGDELARDYRPVVTNGVTGLIDAAHPENAPLLAKTYGASARRRMFEAGGDIACADGSDEAYLEFNGEGRIDTGCVVTKDSRIDADLSLWEANNGLPQYFLYQEPSKGSGVVAYLYMSTESTQKFNYKFEDCNDYTGRSTSIPVSNDRRQFTLDGPNDRITVTRGGEVEYDDALAGNLTRSDGGTVKMVIGNSSCRMRLYGFKVTTDGTVVRDYVPYVTNGVAGLYDLVGAKFYPLAGGKVRGRGAKGRDEFVVRPQPTRIDIGGTGTLACFAAGAQRYDWYENGNLIEGETGDSLKLQWVKLRPHTRTYSVVPVYTVFNETVKGETATAEVEFKPLGTAIILR